MLNIVRKVIGDKVKSRVSLFVDMYKVGDCAWREKYPNSEQLPPNGQCPKIQGGHELTFMGTEEINGEKFFLFKRKIDILYAFRSDKVKCD